MIPAIPSTDGFGQGPGGGAAAGAVPEMTAAGVGSAGAVQVTTLFGETVLGVRQLHDPASGRPRPVTWALLGTGAGVVLLGGVLLLFGQLGLGTLLLLPGLALGVVSGLRLIEERRSPHFTLGETGDTDLPMVSPVPGAPCFPLVESDGTSYALRFTGAMRGDVTLGARRVALEELAPRGLACPAGEIPGVLRFDIPAGARIKVDVGESTLLVDAITPERRLPGSTLGVDWSTQAFSGLSVGIHALVLLLVFAVPPDGKSLSTDLFNTDSKAVKFLIRAPELKEEVPAWLRGKQTQQPGGRKAIGKEGSMGKPTARGKGGLLKVKGPKDTLDPRLARDIAVATARRSGVLGLFGRRGGGPLASIFGGESALGTDAEDALGGLIGNGTGEPYGVGGLGLTGPGRGGGCHGADCGSVPYGRLDTIGGRGPGQGWGPPGGKDLPLRKPTGDGPTVIAEPVKVKGSLDKAIIRRVIRSHLNEVRFCYQKELQSNPEIYGRVVVRFTITQMGQVVVPHVQQSTMANPQVEGCLTQALARWVFPRPENGIVVVTYPFLFHAAGK